MSQFSKYLIDFSRKDISQIFRKISNFCRTRRWRLGTCVDSRRDGSGPHPYRRSSLQRLRRLIWLLVLHKNPPYHYRYHYRPPGIDYLFHSSTFLKFRFFPKFLSIFYHCDNALFSWIFQHFLQIFFFTFSQKFSENFNYFSITKIFIFPCKLKAHNWLLIDKLAIPPKIWKFNNSENLE